jgi:hypothetical protein
MHIRLTLDDRDEVLALFNEDNERTSLMQRFAQDEFGDMNMPVYSEFTMY